MEQFFKDLKAAIEAKDLEAISMIAGEGYVAWHEFEKQRHKLRRQILMAATPSDQVVYDTPLLPDQYRLVVAQSALKSVRELV